MGIILLEVDKNCMVFLYVFVVKITHVLEIPSTLNNILIFVIYSVYFVYSLDIIDL